VKIGKVAVDEIVSINFKVSRTSGYSGFSIINTPEPSQFKYNIS
jgi:hypothetical protein